MKFCPNCGVKLDNDNFKFCPECGYKFDSDTNNSNQSKKSESKGFLGGFIKGIRDQIPDEYVDKIKDNEIVDDAVTHAKIIWHGPQTEKEKAYKERKRQEEEKKDPIKYKISEVTGKHLLDSPYFTERKKLFNVTDGYTYYKDILKWEADNYDLKYEDIEARLDELLKINNAKTIFELRFKYPTCLIKTRENLEQYIKYGDVNPSHVDNEKWKKNASKGLNQPVSLNNTQSKETDENEMNEIRNTKQVDNNINQEIEKPKLNSATATSKKEKVTQQKIDEPTYSDFDLSDLQESLIKSLPVIINPSEYEENIIKKYAESNSEERKELLKDCWTITKLAEEHNINRNEVQKAILTDEFLEKDLIGVFKVNPDNIRSLKILYRKPLTETEQKQETENVTTDEKVVEDVPEAIEEPVVNETTEEETEVENQVISDDTVEEKSEVIVDSVTVEDKNFPNDENIEPVQISEEKIEVGAQVEEEVVEEEVVEEIEEVHEEPIQQNIKTSQENTGVLTKTKDKDYYKKKPKNEKKKGLFSKKTPEEKEFDEKLKYYVGGISFSDYYREKAKEHGKIVTQVNYLYVKSILKDEFEYGSLSVNDMEQRIDELMDLDITCIKYDILDKGYNTSLIKTPQDIQDFLEVTFDGKSDLSHNKDFRQKVLFEKYGINTDEAYCFRCSIEEQRSHTFGNETYRKPSQVYIALFDDYLAIAKESAILQSDLGIRKVFFRNVASIDYDARGKVSLSNSLFIHLKSAESVQLKLLSEKDVAEVQTRFENYMAEKDAPSTVQIKQETSNADELLKYAELYKQGLLTEEEFEAKKKELLS